MDNLLELMSNLKIEAQKEEPDCLLTLSNILLEIGNQDDPTVLCEKVVNDEILDYISKILEKSNVKAQARALELVAEIAKAETLKHSFLDVLCLYLDKFSCDEDIPTHILLSFSCITDTDEGRNALISKDITKYLIKVMQTSKSPEVIETCLELMSNMVEADDAKTQFAKRGVCEVIINTVKHYVNQDLSEFISLIKTATDLLILVLVGDDSMKILYDNGNGFVFLTLVDWLSSSFEELQVAAALAVGNFGRSDYHCIQMVSNGIGKKLISMLSSNSSSDGDIRFQHATLSALRNLSIACENKPVLLSQGALEVLLPMLLKVETYPVVFKLLATLRMLVDGSYEASVQLGRNNNVASRIVKYCETIDHSGVQGEASRLLAWIIKNCKADAETLNCLLSAGCLKHNVLMLGSEHIVMVNEACLALIVIFSNAFSSETMSYLEDVPLNSLILDILKNGIIPLEVKVNVISLIVAISSKDEGLGFIKSEQLKTEILKFKSSHNETVNNLVGILCEKLN